MESAMQCPVDGETLVMADRGGVEIDYCPRCRGVWLDRGELDKIIERSMGAPAAAPVAAAPARPAAEPTPRYQPEPRREEARRRHEDDDDDRRYSKPKRRESFLGELFDF
jgi:uncharacterized protein